MPEALTCRKWAAAPKITKALLGEKPGRETFNWTSLGSQAEQMGHVKWAKFGPT